MRLDMGRVYAVSVIETKEHAMPVVTDFANGSRSPNQGKSRREAIRCLKRQLARTVYTTLRTCCGGASLAMHPRTRPSRSG